MPTLLTQRTSKKRKKPPCGRIIEFVLPHSPFQVLIDQARISKGYSIRELALLIDEEGAHHPYSTLYLWLHSKTGVPTKKSFSNKHVQALAKHLGLKETDIRGAVDTSSYRFTPCAEPVPQPAIDVFAQFITTLENDKRINFNRNYVLNLAKRLYAGAVASKKSPVPPAK